MFAHLFLALTVGVASQSVAAGRDTSLAGSVAPVAVSLQASNAIGGYVFNSEHRPVAQLRVELMNDLGQTLTYTMTTGGGRYEFRGLTPGVYQIRVLTYGTNYVSQTRREEIINFGRRTSRGPTLSGGQFLQVDFILATAGKAEEKNETTGTVFVQKVPEAAQSAYDQALRDLEGGKRDAGVEGLKHAVELFPDYFLALQRLGTEYVEGKQFEPASLVLARAVKVNPHAPQSWFGLGVAQYNLKQLEAAVESLNRSLLYAPDSVNTNMWLGIVERARGNNDLAEKHLKRAKELSHDSLPEAHWQLALLYNKTERFKEAADELELFLKAQPDSRDRELIKKLIKQLREKARGQTSDNRWASR